MRRLSFVDRLGGAFLVSNGIARAARVLRVVHSGKTEVSESGRESWLRAMYWIFVCLCEMCVLWCSESGTVCFVFGEVGRKPVDDLYVERWYGTVLTLQD